MVFSQRFSLESFVCSGIHVEADVIGHRLHRSWFHGMYRFMWCDLGMDFFSCIKMWFINIYIYICMRIIWDEWKYMEIRKSLQMTSFSQRKGVGSEKFPFLSWVKLPQWINHFKEKRVDLITCGSRSTDWATQYYRDSCRWSCEEPNAEWGRMYTYILQSILLYRIFPHNLFGDYDNTNGCILDYGI